MPFSVAGFACASRCASHRVGHDAILLAAATCARATERTVDAWCRRRALPPLRLRACSGDEGDDWSRSIRHFVHWRDTTRGSTGWKSVSPCLMLDAESIDSLKSVGLSSGSFDRVLDEPAVSRRTPSQRFARSRPAAGAPSGEAGLLKRWVDSCSLASEGKWRAGADLARGRLAMRSSRRCSRFSAQSRCCLCIPGRTPPRSACWSVPQKEAEFRGRAIPPFVLNDEGGPADGPLRRRSCATEKRCRLRKPEVCLNSAPPRQNFAPAPLAELAPHTAHNIIVQVRKPNNAGNQKKE